MEAEKEPHLAEIKKLPKNKTYVKTWQEFTNRGMELLVDNPTASRFVLKYIPRTRKFILKVTDDIQFVMKKCKEDVSILIVRNYKIFKSLPYSLEGLSPTKHRKKLKNRPKRSVREIRRRKTRRRNDTSSFICHFNSLVCLGQFNYDKDKSCIERYVVWIINQRRRKECLCP